MLKTAKAIWAASKMLGSGFDIHPKIIVLQWDLTNNKPFSLWDIPLGRAPLPEEYFMGRCGKAGRLNGKEGNWQILWRCQLDKLPFRSNTPSFFSVQSHGIYQQSPLVRITEKLKVCNLPNRMREDCERWNLLNRERRKGLGAEKSEYNWSIWFSTNSFYLWQFLSLIHIFFMQFTKLIQSPTLVLANKYT